MTYWTGVETALKLVELNGKTVDLLAVLNAGITPDHAHIEPTPYEPNTPDDLLKRLEPILYLPRKEQLQQATELYRAYASEHGINADHIYIDPSTNEKKFLSVLRYGAHEWPAEKTIELFPMIDFIIEFRVSPKIAAKVGHVFIPENIAGYFLNATRIGTHYEISIAQAKILAADEIVKSLDILTTWHAFYKNAGSREESIVATEKSRKTITAFLHAVV